MNLPHNKDFNGKVRMIFTCPSCESRITTPSQFDGEISKIDCTICGKHLNATENGEVVLAVEPKKKRASTLSQISWVH
jgi:transcription initiation factor IIE alpha subunit